MFILVNLIGAAVAFACTPFAASSSIAAPIENPAVA
jgi:hypothetical protein